MVSREKVTLEKKLILEKTFTSNDKGFRRIGKGNTIVIHRCKEIMRSLWLAGFRHNAIVRREDLEQHIFLCAGGDYRTIKKYIGFWIYSRGNKVDPPRPIKRMKGYLERLHYVFYIGNGKFQLCHSAVNSEYHTEQAAVDGFYEGNQKVFKEEMCVCSGEVGREAKERSATTTNNKQQQHTTHTQIFFGERLPNVKLSDYEMRLLEASKKGGS